MLFLYKLTSPLISPMALDFSFLEAIVRLNFVYTYFWLSNFSLKTTSPPGPLLTGVHGLKLVPPQSHKPLGMAGAQWPVQCHDILFSALPSLLLATKEFLHPEDL